MIRFENVSKRYDSGQDALADVSFSLNAGEMAFLTGHSGAGKSTLLRLIMLMEHPSKGEVWVDNQHLAKLPKRHIPLLRRKMGVVYQNHQLLFDRSVYDNVALPLIVAGFHPRDIGRRVRAALDKVNLLHKNGRIHKPYQVASNSAWVLPAPSLTSRPFCWQMNRQVIWIQRSVPRLCSCLKNLIRSV